MDGIMGNYALNSVDDLQLLRVAIESARHAVYITDRNGTFLYANPAFAKVTGYAPDEVLGRKTSVLQSGVMDDEYYRRLWKTVLSGRSWRETITNRRKSGELYEAYQIISPILSDGGPPSRFVVIQEDISEQATAERRVRELAREYESVFRNTQDAVFLIQVLHRSEEPEFRFLRLNPTHERLTGLRTEDVRGKTPIELFGPELGGEVVANYRKCYDSREAIVYDEVLDLGHGPRSWRTRLAPVFDGGLIIEIIGTARDITIEERLKSEQQLFFEISPDPFVILTSDGRFHQLSPSWRDLIGGELDGIVGRFLLEYIHPEDRENGLRLLELMAAGQPVSEFEMRFAIEQDTYRWLSWSAASPTREGLIYAVARDIEENKRLREQLVQLSSTDTLTGIANRAKGQSELLREAERSKRYGVPLSLLMFDVDYFKEVNDTHGHALGDEVLQRICEKVTADLRPTDIFARWGGEEFVVVLPDTDADAACRLAERLRQETGALRHSHGRPVTISIGVAEYRDSEDPDTGLLRRADDALYQAKHDGRDRVRLAS